MKQDKGNQIAFQVEKVSVVSINKVKPNSWNPKDKDTSQYKQIERGIAELGQMTPIVVREVKGGYEIIDGEQKYRSCLANGIKKVIIYNEGKVEDVRAMELTIWYEQHAELNKEMLANLVVEAVDEGYVQKLPYTAEDIAKMCKDADVQVVPTDTEIKDEQLEVKLLDEPLHVTDDSLGNKGKMKKVKCIACKHRFEVDLKTLKQIE